MATKAKQNGELTEETAQLILRQAEEKKIQEFVNAYMALIEQYSMSIGTRIIFEPSGIIRKEDVIVNKSGNVLGAFIRK